MASHSLKVRSDTPKNWTKTTWQAFPAAQQPEWPDAGALGRALKQNESYPPLVFAGEARTLLASLGQVATGNAFLLQAYHQSACSTWRGLNS